MAQLEGRVALVTGASRGVGKGIAVGLGEAGAEVWLAARTTTAGAPGAQPGSLEETAREVVAAGGRAVTVACDVTDVAAVERMFARVAAERGALDLLVNAAWGGYEAMVDDGEFTWTRPFWQQPVSRWHSMFDAGLRAAFLCSRLAAGAMVARGRGLIVNVSFWAAQKYLGNAIYGAVKCATDRLTADMAHDLESTGVAAVALYPGLVRTERVLESAAFLDLSNSESPLFSGRAVASLLADPKVVERSGRVLVAAELAREYGFRDLDGRQPTPLTIASA